MLGSARAALLDTARLPALLPAATSLASSGYQPCYQRLPALLVATKARHDTARHGTARLGTARLFIKEARLGTARHGTARHGTARLTSTARHGTASQHGSARLGDQPCYQRLPALLVAATSLATSGYQPC